MPPVSLLIKPASSNCSLRGKYCFYHSLAENRQTNVWIPSAKNRGQKSIH